MFPIRDHNPSEKTPFITYALIAANVLVFISYWPLFSDDRALARFFFEWALLPENVADGRNLHTLVTSMFSQKDGWHLLGNMVTLFFFGPEVVGATFLGLSERLL